MKLGNRCKILLMSKTAPTIPFLTEEEKRLLDDGDMVFLDDDGAEKVEEKNSNAEKSPPKRSGGVTININNSSNFRVHIRSSE